MKRLTCEMCGSTDLIKQDGVFVCQSCGCKYSMEEAKKMMVEGVVEVQGTVKIDNSDAVANYLANARRAKSQKDWIEAEKYYSMVKQNNPTNTEAIVGSAYARAMVSWYNNTTGRDQAFNVLKNSISAIENNYDITKQADNERVIKDIGNDISETIKKVNFFISIYIKATSVAFIDLLENIIKKDEQLYMYDVLIQQYDAISVYLTHYIELEKRSSGPFGAESELSISCKNERIKYQQKKEEMSEKRSALNNKLREQENAAKAARIDKYWEKHPDEKAALDSENARLQEQIDAAYKDIDNVPGEEEIEGLNERRTALRRELDSLGMFKGRQKKELQAQIDELSEEIRVKDITRREKQEEIRKTVIVPLRTRKGEIEKELTKDRP